MCQGSYTHIIYVFCLLIQASFFLFLLMYSASKINTVCLLGAKINVLFVQVRYILKKKVIESTPKKKVNS